MYATLPCGWIDPKNFSNDEDWDDFLQRAIRLDDVEIFNDLEVKEKDLIPNMCEPESMHFYLEMAVRNGIIPKLLYLRTPVMDSWLDRCCKGSDCSQEEWDDFSAPYNFERYVYEMREKYSSEIKALRKKRLQRRVKKLRRKFILYSKAVGWFICRFKAAKARIDFAPGGKGAKEAHDEFMSCISIL